MALLNKNASVGFISTSDGIPFSDSDRLEKLIEIFADMSLKVVLSSVIFKKKDGSTASPTEKASELTSFFLDDNISAIFDVSGGDSCNLILPLLDYEEIRKNKKILIGYSDVSTLLNSLYKVSGIKSFYYNVRALCGDDAENQRIFFNNIFFNDESQILFPYEKLNGGSTRGTIIGGNLRCFLKLAGTKYMPDPAGKILLLESFGGTFNRISSYFAQLEQLDFFSRLSGVILGNFYEAEKNGESERVVDYFTRISGKYNLPLIKTDKIGHKNDSLGVLLGGELTIF